MTSNTSSTSITPDIFPTALAAYRSSSAASTTSPGAVAKSEDRQKHHQKED
jgi:hypothetical protein